MVIFYMAMLVITGLPNWKMVDLSIWQTVNVITGWPFLIAWWIFPWQTVNVITRGYCTHHNWWILRRRPHCHGWVATSKWPATAAVCGQSSTSSGKTRRTIEPPAVWNWVPVHHTLRADVAINNYIYIWPYIAICNHRNIELTICLTVLL